LLSAVEVVGAAHAVLARTTDEGLDQLVLVADVRHRQRPVAAMEGARTALVALGLDEVRQHIVITPAVVAERGPMVVVFALPADVDQAVDRARSTKGLAARPVDAPPVHVRVGVGMETPVVLRAPHRLAVPDRQVNPERPVGRARFQQQHAGRRVFAQARRQHGTGGARTDDDEIERFRHVAVGQNRNVSVRLRTLMGARFLEHNERRRAGAVAGIAARHAHGRSALLRP
jgi:hypothetical protein